MEVVREDVPSSILHLRSLSEAGNGTRTRDPNLGKVVLYQLSYSREEAGWRTPLQLTTSGPARVHAGSPTELGHSGDGGEGNRTPDLLNAIQALSQLSYAPAAVTVDLRSFRPLVRHS